MRIYTQDEQYFDLMVEYANSYMLEGHSKRASVGYAMEDVLGEVDQEIGDRLSEVVKLKIEV